MFWPREEPWCDLVGHGPCALLWGLWRVISPPWFGVLHCDHCTQAFMMALENAWVSSPHQDGRSCVGRGVLHSCSAYCFLVVSTGHTCCPMDPQGLEAIPVLTLVALWDRGCDSTWQSS